MRVQTASKVVVNRVCDAAISGANALKASATDDYIRHDRVQTTKRRRQCIARLSPASTSTSLQCMIYVAHITVARTRAQPDVHARSTIYAARIRHYRKRFRPPVRRRVRNPIRKSTENYQSSAPLTARYCTGWLCFDRPKLLPCYTVVKKSQLIVSE